MSYGYCLLKAQQDVEIMNRLHKLDLFYMKIWCRMRGIDRGRLKQLLKKLLKEYSKEFYAYYAHNRASYGCMNIITGEIKFDEREISKQKKIMNNAKSRIQELKSEIYSVEKGGRRE